MIEIEVWTDGSCKANGTKKAIGAWGYLVRVNGETVTKACGTEYLTTNNRMEMEGIARALIHVNSHFDNFHCTIHSDSAYVMNCIDQRWYHNWARNGWKTANKGAVKNVDLWQKMISFFDDDRFSFVKVKGHAGIEFNEEVDSIVQTAAAEAQIKASDLSLIQ